MSLNWNDPLTWGGFKPQFIAHDVGRSRDRSTAVVGGNCAFRPELVGIKELLELPNGFGSVRASALAEVDRRYDRNSIIIADLSFDPTYAEILFEVFGWRVIGLHISRYGDGMNFGPRPVKGGAIRVYTIGRSYLLELMHAALETHKVRFVSGPESQRAYAQLAALNTEITDSGITYTCPPGQHDDLGMSCAMLVWGAQHPHNRVWFNKAFEDRRPRVRRQTHGWGAFT